MKFYQHISAATNSSPKTSFKLEPAKLHSPFSVRQQPPPVRAPPVSENNKENEKGAETPDTTKPGLSDAANERLLGDAGATSASVAGGAESAHNELSASEAVGVSVTSPSESSSG